jgi:hypothetical protein
MELLYFFLGAAFVLVTALLIYTGFFHINRAGAGRAFVQGKARREDIFLEAGDFKLLTRTTELILVPVTLRAEELLNQSPDAASGLYYRAIVVERDNLPKFAEHCVTAGLTMTFQKKPVS